MAAFSRAGIEISHAKAPLTVKPNALSFTALGAAAEKSVVVAETGYKGTISAANGCGKIAGLSPSSGKGPSATFKITPDKLGKCTITFSDSNHQTAKLAITVEQGVNANPDTVTLCPSKGIAACKTSSQEITLSEIDFTGTFTEKSVGCSSTFVTVAKLKSDLYKVTGESTSGKCNAIFTGSAGKTLTVPIAIVGNVSATATTVTICPSKGIDACSPSSQTIKVSQPEFSGPFTEKTTCSTSVATVKLVGGTNYDITGASTTGACTVTFTGAVEKNATVQIKVNPPPPGTVTANPTSVTLCPSTGLNSCNTFSQQVTLGQPFFTGTFTESDGCNANVVTIVPLTPSVYKITGGSTFGTCSATFVGGGGKFVTVPITIVGNVNVSPASVSICPSSGSDKCNPNTATVKVSQLEYSGTFSESDNCDPSVATVQLVSGVTYQINGQSTLGNCTATFTGILGKTGTAQINVVNGVVVNLHRHP
ncbi:MAG: hypothetical protein JO199_13720 [Candidatus Eremiobacteraeota bacterium]|nr:hypothetical protein [Candidatus Eremiobacteraeota bacterium]